VTWTPLDLRLPRTERWRRIFRAFCEATGLKLGRPPELYRGGDPDDDSLDLAKGFIVRLDPDTWRWECDTRAGLTEDGQPRFDDYGIPNACLNEWPYRDEVLQKAFSAPAFRAAVDSLPPRTEPGYAARVRTWQALQDLHGAAIRIRAEWARHFVLPWEVSKAVDMIAESRTPPAPQVANGTPPDPGVQARDRIVAVLAEVRRNGRKDAPGRPLRVYELMWLLMLAIPERYLDEDERSLYDLVRNARPDHLKASRRGRRAANESSSRS
jgi:hypothetical protein